MGCGGSSGGNAGGGALEPVKKVDIATYVLNPEKDYFRKIPTILNSEVAAIVKYETEII